MSLFTSRRHLWAYGALLLLYAILFAQTWFFDFIALDDNKHIWNNPYVLELSTESLLFFWKNPYFGLYVPLTYNLWTLLASLTQELGWSHPVSQISAELFHFTQSFLHLLNACLVYALFRHLLRQKFSPDEKASIEWSALAAGILFFIHPLQVEVVAWSSALKDTLSGLLGLSSLWLYWTWLAANTQTSNPQTKKDKRKKQARKQMDSGWWNKIARQHPHQLYAASTLLFALSLLAKPSAVVLPIAAILINYLFLQKSWRSSLRGLILWLGLTLPLVYFTKSLQPDARLDFNLALWERPLVALYSVGFYIKKFFLPWNLAPDYGLNPVRALEDTQRWFHWGLALGLFAILAWLWAKKRVWLVGPLLILLGLLPTLGLIPFEFQNMSTVGDRYFYLVPMLGAGFIVAFALRGLQVRQSATLLLLMTLTLAPLTFLQTQKWKNNQKLFAHTLSVNPKSYLAYNSLGIFAMRSGDLDRAAELFRQSLQQKSDYLTAQSNLGVVYFEQRRFHDVISHYEELLSHHPNLRAGSNATFADVLFNLGAAYVNTGKTEQALQRLKKATEVNVNHFKAHYHLGRILSHMGKKQEAAQAFRQALRIQPRHALALRELKKLQGQMQ